MKKDAVSALKLAQAVHETEAKSVGAASVTLFNIRRDSSNSVIPQVETYINTLANTPKEFDRTFAEYRAEFKVFNEIIAEIETEAKKVELKAGTGAAAGIATGVGFAAFAPSIAMAVATTFGTASTGTAISALWGVAATNAALAWLGGGALAVGGGGMVAGEAFLALAGPVGWAIGGTALVGAGLFARRRNRAIAQNASVEKKKIDVQVAALKAARYEIAQLYDATERHVGGVLVLLKKLEATAPGNYSEFNNVEKDMLGALINHINSLSALLNKKVQA